MSIVFPFDSVKVSSELCSGLKYTKGQFVQCSGDKCDGDLCKKCTKEAGANESGKPAAGTVDDILREGESYTDSKGRKAAEYSKTMKALDVTKEQVLEAAAALGITVEDRHFVVTAKPRGRPKNPKPLVQEESPVDLLAPAEEKDVEEGGGE